ncbi:MAG: transcription antitermination protein NusB, partial [Planctomycetota bacterium]
MPDPRRAAAETLLLLETRRTTVHDVWEGPRAPAETALVLGALRRRGTLDAILASHSTRKLAALKPETRSVLRVALFEMIFMDGTPPHAIVHAAVENVRELGREADVGFSNALLRSILRGRRRLEGGGGGEPRRTIPRDGKSVVFE